VVLFDFTDAEKKEDWHADGYQCPILIASPGHTDSNELHV